MRRTPGTRTASRRPSFRKAQIEVAPRPLNSHARCTVTASGLLLVAARPVISGRNCRHGRNPSSFKAVSTEWGVRASQRETPTVGQRPPLGAHHCSLGPRDVGSELLTHTVSVTVGLCSVRSAPTPSNGGRYNTYNGGQAVIGERNTVMLPSRCVGAAVQNVAHCCMRRRRFSNMSPRR